jgi:hypothetical protein
VGLVDAIVLAGCEEEATLRSTWDPISARAYTRFWEATMHGLIGNINHISGTQGRSLRRIARRLGLIAAILVIADGIYPFSGGYPLT